MNIASSACTGQRPIDLQLSNGDRKSLTPSGNGSEISLVKSQALKSLAHYECIVCFDVHEKTLQTRCCDAVLCASCYLSLSTPKECPNDRAALSGVITDDLKPAGRLVNSQVEQLSAEFHDIEPKETDYGKERAQTQNNALAQLQDYGKNTKQLAAAAVADTRYKVKLTSFSGPVIIGNNNRLTIGGNRFTPNPSTGNVIRLPVRDITLPSFPSRHQSETVRAFHYPENDFDGLLDVNVYVGNIVITKQDSDRQNTVSVVASSDPSVRNNQLSIRVRVGSLELKLPDEFSKPVRIITNAGNICTQGGYPIKSGGEIRTIKSGNVNIKIDSQLVQVNPQSTAGFIKVKDSNHGVDWERRELLVTTNHGNITVSDR